MIHECYRFEGFDAEAFAALVSLLRPSRAFRGSMPTPKRSGLLVVLTDDDGAVLGATHTRRGRLRGVKTAKDPEALAHVHRAARVVVLREGALEDLSERIALRVRRDQDYLEQLFTVLESLRELERAGSLSTYPVVPARMPLPAASTVRHALDLFAGDGEAFVLCIHGERSLSQAYAFRRRDDAIDAVIGPRAIARYTGALPGTFEGDHDAVVAAVDREIAPVHLALSLREGVAHKMITQRTPGALSSAVAARDVLARPAPAVVSVGVALDALASVLHGVRVAFDDSPLVEAVAHLLRREGSLPGLDALESWFDLLAPRNRRP